MRTLATCWAWQTVCSCYDMLIYSHVQIHIFSDSKISGRASVRWWGAGILMLCVCAGAFLAVSFYSFIVWTITKNKHVLSNVFNLLLLSVAWPVARIAMPSSKRTEPSSASPTHPQVLMAQLFHTLFKCIAVCAGQACHVRWKFFAVVLSTSTYKIILSQNVPNLSYAATKASQSLSLSCNVMTPLKSDKVEHMVTGSTQAPLYFAYQGISYSHLL